MVQKSQTTTWDVQNLLNNGINYLSLNWLAGFFPSTVCMLILSLSDTHVIHEGLSSSPCYLKVLEPEVGTTPELPNTNERHTVTRWHSLNKWIYRYIYIIIYIHRFILSSVYFLYAVLNLAYSSEKFTSRKVTLGSPFSNPRTQLPTSPLTSSCNHGCESGTFYNPISWLRLPLLDRMQWRVLASHDLNLEMSSSGCWPGSTGGGGWGYHGKVWPFAESLALRTPGAGAGGTGNLIPSGKPPKNLVQKWIFHHETNGNLVRREILDFKSVY